MAFPPPFPNPLLPRLPTQPTQSVQFTGQKFGFFSHRQGVLPGLPMLRPRFRPNFVPREPRPPHPMAKPTGPPTTTTVFIGNISDKCPDRIIQEVLKKCGSVCNWKRLQDSSGKFKAFGFCDFMYPDGAKKALSVLKDFPVGDKRLNVKADEQTEKMLEEFSKSKLINANEESDESVRESIRKFLEEEAVDLVDMPIDEGHVEEQKEKSPAEGSTKSSHKDGSLSRSPTPAGHRHKKKRSNTSPKRKKSRHYSSSSSDESSSFYSSASSTESRKIKKKKNARRKSLSSEDSDEAEERRKLKKELKEKEEAYLSRLKKWEEREKRMAKLYEKEREEEKQRQKTLQKEAKKLRQFLEDYVDERDDPKYYRGSALFQRKRNYERERETDAKDRQEERVDLEEIRKSILEEKRGEATAKTEVKDGGEAEKVEIVEFKGDEELGENGDVNGGTETQKAEWETVGETVAGSIHRFPVETQVSVEVESPTPMKKTIMTTLQPKQTMPLPKLNGVFQEEEEDEVDTLHQIKKKIKPFEITREDRLQSMTPEERKKMIKDLIARIPTDKAMLFAFEVCWEFVDENLMEQRVRPWVNKKICEYIGEEELSLVSFICEKISNKCSADAILQDLSMVLDDEAEVFMVKLWRLIVYESEAKRLGLNAVVTGSSSSASSQTPAVNR